MPPVNYRAAMNSYRGVSVESIVESAAPHQLVRMLFDGARAAVAVAKGHLERRETAPKCEAIAKAISIIDGGLKASLDLNVGGELTRNLSDLYAYMSLRLFQANVRNDASALDEVAQLLEQLGSAWATVAANEAAKEPAATARAPGFASAPSAQASPPRRAAAPPPAVSRAIDVPGPGSGDAPTGSGEEGGAAPINRTVQQSRLAAAYGVR